MRLDKFLSDNTDLTRSLAQRALKHAEVTVNGQVIKQGAFKLQPADEVVWQGNVITKLGLRYFMLNKPIGYICANEDGGHPTVLDLIEEPNKANLHVVGRLDIDTTGLVLITDDGQWSHKVTSPNRQCGKLYHVELADPVPEEAIAQFAQGLMLRGEKQLTRPAELTLLSPFMAHVVLHEGRYHQVKRMFAAIGNKVISLHRAQVGDIELDQTLAQGEYRALTPSEVASVK